MIVLKGIPVSEGVVIGTAVVLRDQARRPAVDRAIAPADVQTEVERFRTARDRAVDELGLIFEEAQDEMGEEAAKIFQVHGLMLRDPGLNGRIEAWITDEHRAAESAVELEFQALAHRFKSKDDTAFQTKANDIQDLCDRLHTQLGGGVSTEFDDMPPNSVVVASDLTPSQTAGFDRDKVSGFVTAFGGPTSHTAIVARALGLPAVVGCQDVTSVVQTGDLIVIDGRRGTVQAKPDETALGASRSRAEADRERRGSLDALKDQPAVTLDGTGVELLGNIEFPREAAAVASAGAEGVGLYRTEFLYLTGRAEPTEDDHFEAYRQCLQDLGGLPLTVRTVDLGADKYTQLRAMVPERNPFLGLRSIRYCLKNPTMFKRQLRAILRASVVGPVKLMFPLVTTIDEFRHARMHVHDAMEDLDDQGLEYDRNIQLGMMVEVPSAAVQAAAFAREVDFFSIGTNDLVQYTLAVDRTNERVAELYAPMNPAVLKLIRDVARAGRRRSIPVSCCGEAAADPVVAVLLIGLGLRTLSVTASAIAPLKRAIRSVRLTDCERIARRALAFDSETLVAGYARDRLKKIAPEVFETEPGEV